MRLTADRFARVLRRIEAGDSVALAARAEGLTPSQVYNRLKKVGMKPPRPRPVTAGELDRLLYPSDPPLTQRMLDYLAAFDAHLCDRDNPQKFVQWRVSARELLGDRLDEPPSGVREMRAIVEATRR